MKSLSERQQQVLNFITRRTEQASQPPTVREIAAHFRMASPRSVQDHLERLCDAGYLKIKPRVARGIQLLKKAAGIPLLGRVPAGPLAEAIEDVETYLPAAMLEPHENREGAEIFALRVRGDSMVNAGILEGDLVLVKYQVTARNGDIVVARIGDDTTLKRLVRKPGAIYLAPENPRYKPIELSQETQIVGKVTKVIRSYN